MAITVSGLVVSVEAGRIETVCMELTGVVAEVLARVLIAGITAAVDGIVVDGGADVIGVDDGTNVGGSATARRVTGLQLHSWGTGSNGRVKEMTRQVRRVHLFSR